MAGLEYAGEPKGGEQGLFAPEFDLIVNTVNCKGAMGAGLAKAFAARYPAILAPYKEACDRGLFKPGGAQLLRIDRRTGERTKEPGSLAIVNLATKDDWQDASKLEWVETALDKLVDVARHVDAKTIGLPKMGAGLGGLDWADVHYMMKPRAETLAAEGRRVVIFGDPAQHERMSDSIPAYAGIGARDTPEAELKRMKDVGEGLARLGYVCRSGGAIGADSAFERGCDRAGGLKEIFLTPEHDRVKNTFGTKPGYCTSHISQAQYDLAFQYHSTLHKRSKRVQNLMARNGSQVLGEDLDTPSKLVICWTEGGRIKGGTGQALRIAEAKDIPVLNLGDPRVKSIGVDTLLRAAGECIEKSMNREAFETVLSGLGKPGIGTSRSRRGVDMER